MVSNPAILIIENIAIVQNHLITLQSSELLPRARFCHFQSSRLLQPNRVQTLLSGVKKIVSMSKSDKNASVLLNIAGVGRDRSRQGLSDHPGHLPWLLVRRKEFPKVILARCLKISWRSSNEATSHFMCYTFIFQNSFSGRFLQPSSSPQKVI